MLTDRPVRIARGQFGQPRTRHRATAVRRVDAQHQRQLGRGQRPELPGGKAQTAQTCGAQPGTQKPGPVQPATHVPSIRKARDNSAAAA